jgi:putative nucleotidyltransferase-like protein
MVARAEQERVAPLLYAALRGGDAPPAVLARLRASWIAAQRQSLLAGDQLREIVRALGDAGIPTIVLKGPALAAAYYDDPALRPFTDLDLLVRRDHRARGLAVLAALGYVHGSPGRSLAYELDHAGAVYLVAASGSSRLPVDLHWECIAHPGGSHATELAAAEIWQRAVPASEWGESAHALAPEDLLVYLAAHLAIHHTLAGVLWQLDIALLLQRHAATLDWEAVLERARRWHAAAAVYFPLRVVSEQLGAVAPEAAMLRLWPGALRVAVIDRLRHGGGDGLQRLEYVVGLLLLDRRADIARALVAGLVPTPRWLRSRYEARSLLAAYAMHYGRLAGIATRAVCRRGPK